MVINSMEFRLVQICLPETLHSNQNGTIKNFQSETDTWYLIKKDALPFKLMKPIDIS